MLVSIPAIRKSKSKVEDIDIAMISMDANCITYYLEKAQVFTIAIKDI